MHVNNTIAQQRHGNYEVAMLGVVVVRRAGRSPIRMRYLNCPDGEFAQPWRGQSCGVACKSLEVLQQRFYCGQAVVSDVEGARDCRGKTVDKLGWCYRELRMAHNC